MEEARGAPKHCHRAQRARASEREREKERKKERRKERKREGRKEGNKDRQTNRKKESKEGRTDGSMEGGRGKKPAPKLEQCSAHMKWIKHEHDQVSPQIGATISHSLRSRSPD